MWNKIKTNHEESDKKMSENLNIGKIKLYKFRPLANDKDFGYAKEILETRRFWCSSFSELNDPMEGVFSFKNGNDDIVGDIFNIKKRYKICSFSGRAAFENPAIWGYYANGFKGIAIEIEADKLEIK